MVIFLYLLISEKKKKNLRRLDFLTKCPTGAVHLNLLSEKIVKGSQRVDVESSITSDQHKGGKGNHLKRSILVSTLELQEWFTTEAAEKNKLNALV